VKDVPTGDHHRRHVSRSIRSTAVSGSRCPPPLTRGATYRLTLKGKDGRIKDTSGNELGVAQDPKTSVVIGDAATDVSLEFIARDNPIEVLTSFKLQARPDYPGGALRDLAQSGNLAFVSALDAGLLVYDLSDPDALQKDKRRKKQPDPYSVVPARWINPIDGHLMSGASGYDQYWAVTTDQHNRVFAAGFLSTLASVRIFKIEDFVKAHNDATAPCAEA